MAIKLNERGVSYAKGRISRAKIEYDEDFAFSDEERNALWAEGAEAFGDWHLGKDTEAATDTAAHYLFAYGKGKVSRAALAGIVKEARKRKGKEPACDAIAKAAQDLLNLIDSKRENGRRCMFLGPKDNPEGVILLDASHVIELAHPGPNMVEGGGSEGWTQIARTGKFLGHWQGPFTLTEDDLAVCVENFHRFVNPLMFDYGHESAWNSAALASGWGHEMALGKAGQALHSNTEWTKLATDRIRAGELKYISPVIMFHTIDPYTGEDLGPSIWTVALLNTPFLDGMDPVEIGAQIAATRQALGGAPPRRQWRMNTQSPAPAEVISNSTPAMAEGNTVAAVAAQEDTVDRKTICTALGLPETATDQEISKAIEAGKVLSAKAQADADRVALEAKTAQDRVLALEAEKKARAEAEAKDLVERYIKAGRLAPASRELAITLALNDRASFELQYGKVDEPRPAVVPMATTPAATPQPGIPSSATLTEAERAVCSASGIDPEKFAAERDRRASKGILGMHRSVPFSATDWVE